MWGPIHSARRLPRKGRRSAFRSYCVETVVVREIARAASMRCCPAVVGFARGHARHRRLYGMRQDTESLNAQLDRAFYGRRLPAWGLHNQTTVVLLAALAENAWARHIWIQAVAEQHGGEPPPQRNVA